MAGLTTAKLKPSNSRPIVGPRHATRGGGEWSKTKNETPKTPLSRTIKCRPLKGYTLDKTQRKHTPKSPSSKRQRERRKRALRTLAEGVGQSGPKGRTVQSTLLGKTPRAHTAQRTGQSDWFKNERVGQTGQDSAQSRTEPQWVGLSDPLGRTKKPERVLPRAQGNAHGSDHPIQRVRQTNPKP